MVFSMQDLRQLSPSQLLDLVSTKDKQLATKDSQLAEQSKEVLRREDVIKQLEAQVEELKKDYLELWQERFEAKSERYVEDPNQLQLDYGDTGTTGVLEVEDLLWIQKVVDKAWEASTGGVSLGFTPSKALKPLGQQSQQIREMLCELLLAVREEQRSAKAQYQQDSP